MKDLRARVSWALGEVVSAMAGAVSAIVSSRTRASSKEVKEDGRWEFN